MSPLLANAVGLSLYAAALLPLIAAAFSTSGRKIMFVYTAALVGLVAAQTGIFHRSALTRTDVTVRALAPTNEEQCKQILDLMRQSGLSFDLTDLSAPRIVGNNADRIPPEVHDSLLACAEQSTDEQNAPAIN